MLCSNPLPLQPRCVRRASAAERAPEKFQWKGEGSSRAEAWERLALEGRGGYAPDGTGLEVFVCDEGPEEVSASALRELSVRS